MWYSVSDSFGNGGGSVPLEYVELELMLEWGLTPIQFDTVPEITIDKILSYRAAKAEGEERNSKSQNTKKK